MKKILAIESSCDETACAIVSEDLKVLSSLVSSQIATHAAFGGVIPEVASRMHVEQIAYVIKEALKAAALNMDDIAGVAYTIGPGLVGCLHVGAMAAKTLAYFYHKPLIGVHHLRGHIFINELVKPLKYPLLALVVSGGHTELVYVKDDDHFEIIGTTLDDAIGETYDKVARVLGLTYPGGPKIDALAKKGKAVYPLPFPKVSAYDFSFSGLKNATIQLVNKSKDDPDFKPEDLACSFQERALECLIDKTLKVLREKDVQQFLIAGGVACNSRLRALVNEKITMVDTILPPLAYTTDNAVMIACAAWHYYHNGHFVTLDAASDPSLSIE